MATYSAGWLNIMTNGLCFRCDCPGLGPHCHSPGLLHYPLDWPSVSCLFHSAFIFTHCFCLKHKTGFAIYQFKNSLASVFCLFPCTTKSALFVIFQIFFLCSCPIFRTCPLAISLLSPKSLHFCLWNSPCYTEKLGLNATSSSMKPSPGFYPPSANDH